MCVPVFAPTADLSWDSVPAVHWSMIEALSAVICINLPPCRQFIRRMLDKYLPGSGGGGGGVDVGTARAASIKLPD